MKSTEAYILTMDFSTIEAFGSVVSSNARGTTSVKAYLNGTDVTATMVSSEAFSGAQLQALIHSGEAGKTYEIEFSAADTLGQFYCETVRIAVI